MTAQKEEVGEHTASKEAKPQWRKPLRLSGNVKMTLNLNFEIYS